MSISKIVDRKNNKVTEAQKVEEKRKAIVSMFHEYVVNQSGELAKLFPYVIVGDGNRDEILAVSYNNQDPITNKSYSIGYGTHNIVMSMNCLGLYFNVGFQANSAGVMMGKQIPFSIDMNKTQLKKVFKQVIEALVSGAYYKQSDFYKENKEGRVIHLS